MLFLDGVSIARNGGEPVLIEALTYRLCDHTTADDASRYRSAGAVAAQQAHDPLTRLKRYLVDTGRWSDALEEQLDSDCMYAVEAAVKAYLDTPAQPPESMFDFLYEQLPDPLSDQREHARGRKTDD